MKRFFNGITITTGLAIFAMLFGAGNLMFPIKVGLNAGDKTFWAMIGFLITGVFLPVLGLVSIILFDGDYHRFFERIGKIPGKILLAICIFIIGPIVAMPRIVTFSYAMTAPFLGVLEKLTLPLGNLVPNPQLLLFSIGFLGLTFLATMRESKIIDLLGYVISPILLISLSIIIFKGLIGVGTMPKTIASTPALFWESLKYGYNTLDVLGGIFFSSIIIHILRQKLPGTDIHKLALTGLKAGAIGTVLLGIVYFGLSYLGVFHGYGLDHVYPGILFSTISFRVLGSQGALIVATAVLMACFSTIIALSAVFAEFLEVDVFGNKISYQAALMITLLLTLIPSNF